MENLITNQISLLSAIQQRLPRLVIMGLYEVLYLNTAP
jgi:hypothetical protein